MTLSVPLGLNAGRAGGLPRQLYFMKSSQRGKAFPRRTRLGLVYHLLNSINLVVFAYVTTQVHACPNCLSTFPMRRSLPPCSLALPSRCRSACRSDPVLDDTNTEMAALSAAISIWSPRGGRPGNGAEWSPHRSGSGGRLEGVQREWAPFCGSKTRQNKELELPF